MQDFLRVSQVYGVPTTIFAVLATCLIAFAYMRRYALARPPVGVFNGRDVVALYAFIIGLPLLYIIMPPWLLLGFLILTFCSALSIGLRPVLPRGYIWPLIGLLAGLDIWLMRTVAGTVRGWQIELAVNSLLVMCLAVAVANLYVQGGMKVKHVALFALSLGVYDYVFLGFTRELADSFFGHPLNPAMGMRYGLVSVDIGLGDLLVYALFTLTLLKAWGKKPMIIGLGVITLFGAIIPSSAVLLISTFDRGGGNVVTPAQMFFGPAAILTYLWMRRRYGTERTIAEYYAAPYADIPPVRSGDARPVSPAVPASVPEAARVSATVDD